LATTWRRWATWRGRWPEAAKAPAIAVGWPIGFSGLSRLAYGLASIDFFVVPTAWFRLLFGFIVLHHERRRIVHFAVTADPAMVGIVCRITEAFPWDEAPASLIRDRDQRLWNHLRPAHSRDGHS